MNRHPFAMTGPLEPGAAIEGLVQQLLDRLSRPLTLVDVGASGHAPAIWRPLARKAILVGFDPDDRQIEQANPEGFFRRHLLNCAITAESQEDQIHFHLTKSPFCSSSLRPDHRSLADYLFSDLFEPVGQATATARRLDQALAPLKLPAIDWLKMDTQGTDGRILQSLPADLLRQVMAIDIEPGLMDAYVGEDLFVDVHRWLTANGFWLSNLNVLGSVRGRRDTLNRLAAQGCRLSADDLAIAVRPSPGWCEARYLRLPQTLTPSGQDDDAWLILAIAALQDGQSAFVLDLAVEHQKRFGDDACCSMMVQTIADDIRRRAEKIRQEETSLARRLGHLARRCRKSVVDFAACRRQEPSAQERV